MNEPIKLCTGCQHRCPASLKPCCKARITSKDCLNSLTHPNHMHLEWVSLWAPARQNVLTIRLYLCAACETGPA